MAYKLALAQVSHPDDGDVMSLVRRTCRQASDMGAQLVIFPESLMTRFENDIEGFRATAQPTDGPFAKAVDAIARDFGLWVIYTINEENPQGDAPFNTVVLTDGEGIQRASYRKVHLFDSNAVRESDKMSAGEVLFDPIQTPCGRIGLGICYDVRFPELARKQALEGCELLVYPAAWVDGPNKAMQWETLLRARAIENGIFVAGVSRPDEGYVGRSYVFSPVGTLVASSSAKADDIVIAQIDLGEIASARGAIPSLEHRRPELY